MTLSLPLNPLYNLLLYFLSCVQMRRGGTEHLVGTWCPGWVDPTYKHEGFQTPSRTWVIWSGGCWVMVIRQPSGQRADSKSCSLKSYYANFINSNVRHDNTEVLISCNLFFKPYLFAQLACKREEGSNWSQDTLAVQTVSSVRFLSYLLW